MKDLAGGLIYALIAAGFGGAAIWYIHTAAAYLHSVGLIH